MRLKLLSFRLYLLTRCCRCGDGSALANCNSSRIIFRLIKYGNAALAAETPANDTATAVILPICVNSQWLLAGELGQKRML